MFQCIVSFTKNYESIAIWAEGIALVLLFVLEFAEFRKQGAERQTQHEENALQLDVARKQIHAERVAEIFKALRRFERFVMEGVYSNQTVGPDKDFSEFGDYSRKGGKVFQQYLDLQEAYYLSYLVSDPLAAYMKQRMVDADRLQRVKDPVEFDQRLKEFKENWDVYKMAAAIRELS